MPVSFVLSYFVQTFLYEMFSMKGAKHREVILNTKRKETPPNKYMSKKFRLSVKKNEKDIERIAFTSTF